MVGLSEHPSHHVRCAWETKTTQKKPFKWSWWSKFLWDLRLTAEKFMSNYWKRNPRLRATLLFLFLSFSTVYNRGIFCMSHSPNMIKWHNSEYKWTNICQRSIEYYSLICPSPSVNNCFNKIAEVLSNSVILTSQKSIPNIKFTL